MSNDSQTDEFQKYELMRVAGSSAKEAYLQAKADDVSPIGCIRMLEAVFDLSLVKAKEVMIVGDGLGNSIEDYEEKVITGLHNIVKLDEEEQNRSAEGD